MKKGEGGSIVCFSAFSNFPVFPQHGPLEHFQETNNGWSVDSLRIKQQF